MSSSLPISTAIVVAGGLIGLGLFFGLRERGRDVGPSPAATPIETQRAERGERRPPERSPTEPRSAGRGADRVAQDVGAALDAQRAALVEKCWKPYEAASPPPKPPRWLFNFSIGADGTQLARGVAEQRGTGNPAITRCILDTLAPVTIPPPGAAVTVDVPFGLP